MKRTGMLCVAVISVLAAAAGAQQEGKPDPVGEHLFPPELIMQNQQAINLDASQKTYIRGELTRAQTRFTELQWQLQDAMEGLVALLKTEQPDEQQVLAQLEKVLSTEREIKRAQLSLMVRLKGKLSSEQQAQLRRMRRPGRGS